MDAAIPTDLTPDLYQFLRRIRTQVDRSASLSGVVAPATGATTAAFGDFINADASGGALTVSLPAITLSDDGRVIAVRKKDNSANVVTVSPDGDDTINGASSLGIATQYNTYTLMADFANTEWMIV